MPGLPQHSPNSPLYAVFGNPIAHSKSPDIHQQFAEQLGISLTYDKRAAELDGFIAAMQDFQKAGGKGCNITVPFKTDAFHFASTLSDRAKRAEAVNTLILTDDGWHGDNTDGKGLADDLTQNLAWQLSNKRILILGAGGAVKGVLPVLSAFEGIEISLYNRTTAKAEQLAASYLNVTACTAEGLKKQPPFAMIINATSTGLSGENIALPASLITTETKAYDMVYGAKPTPFMAWAENLGAETADGLGMLVEQAAESFFLWHNSRPKTQTVIAKMRAQLNAQKPQ